MVHGPLEKRRATLRQGAVWYVAESLQGENDDIAAPLPVARWPGTLLTAGHALGSERS